MKTSALLLTLHHHEKLSEKRNVAYSQNKSAKYLIWGLNSFLIAYLIFIAVMLSLIVNEDDSMTGYEMMYNITPILLPIGFILRLAIQQTPSQRTIPYLLLPLPRYAIIDYYLIRSLLSPINLIGFALFLPYALMSVFFAEGIITTLGFLTGLLLLVLINSQWYLLSRSLINVHYAWWLLPIGGYTILFSPLFTPSTSDINYYADFYSVLGEKLSFWNPTYYFVLLTILLILFLINQRVQHSLITAEIYKPSKSHARSFKLDLLNTWGVNGQFVKLEILSMIRNKNQRKTVLSATAIIIVFSAILAFSDIYNTSTLIDFWIFYCFSLYGAMLLTKAMCYEGNYIESLIVRQQNLIHLLYAKFYIHCSLLLVPLTLLLPSVIMGKCTLLQLFSYATFIAGVAFLLLFQTAVFNKQSMPLNTKFVGKGGMENSYMQVVIQLFVFAIPLATIRSLQAILPDTIAHVILLAIGLIFIVTHRLWLRNIYNRMMLRRYANLEGFRNSR